MKKLFCSLILVALTIAFTIPVQARMISASTSELPTFFCKNFQKNIYPYKKVRLVIKTVVKPDPFPQVERITLLNFHSILSGVMMQNGWNIYFTDEDELADIIEVVVDPRMKGIVLNTSISAGDSESTIKYRKSQYKNYTIYFNAVLKEMTERLKNQYHLK